VLVLSFLLLQSRSLPLKGEVPAFFVPAVREHCWVEAQNHLGIRQIYDVSIPADVEEMTRWIDASPAQARSLRSLSYISGQHIEIISKYNGSADIEFTWMRAGKRMALGILLHPDRMDALDWQDLTGIGPALAQRIIVNRQNNGDFGSIASLTRVSGIGDKTLDSMRPWFVHPTKL